MKRVICWDLWGTLIESSWDKSRYIDELVEIEQRYSESRDRASIEALIRGQFMTNAAHNQKAFDLAVTGNTTIPYGWCVGMMGVSDGQNASSVANLWKVENELSKWLPDAIGVLARVNQLGTQVLVSNTTEAGWVTVDEKLGLTSHSMFADRIVLSCDLPVAKPDPHVWETVERRFPAEEYWMIGNDPIMDIAVPAAMGWKTILVNHPKGVSLRKVAEIIKED